MRILAAILAVLLFFPGACFAFFAFSWPYSKGGILDTWPLLLIAIAIFAVMYFLGRYGFGDKRDIR